MTARPYDVVLGAGASREEWLEARRTGIGGSDAASVLGLGGYSSALDVYASKVAVELEDRDTEAMELGRLLEDPVAKLWALRHRVHVRRGPALVRSTRWPWLLASFDRLVYPHARGGRPVAGYEGKLRHLFAGADWEDGVPPDVVAQCWTYLAVSGLPRWHVACLVGGSELRSYTIERDEDALEELAEETGRWWREHVEARVLPPVDPHRSEASTLAALYPGQIGTALELDERTTDLVRRTRRVKDRAQHAEKVARRLEDRVRRAMQDSAAAYAPGARKPLVTWKPGERTGLDLQHLKAHYPEAYEASLKTTSTRTLLIKKDAA